MSGLESTTSINGETLMAFCQYSGSVEPTSINWYFRDSPLPLEEVPGKISFLAIPFTSNSMGSNIAILAPTAADNSGKYVCKATIPNGGDVSHTTTAHVRSSIIVDSNGNEVTQASVTTGELTVSCKVTADEYPGFVDWYLVNIDADTDTKEAVNSKGIYQAL